MTLKKTVLFLFLSLIFTQAYSQHFEWASTGTNLFAGFKAGVVDNDGNYIVAGEAPLPNFINGDSYLHSSTGSSHKINVYSNPLIIVSYSPSGNINWIKEIDGGRGYPEVIAMDIDAENNIYVLGSGPAQIYASDIGEQYDIYGHYFIYCVNSNGRTQSVLTDSLEMINDPTSMHLTPDGNLLIAGELTDDLKYGDLSLSAGEGGANYIIKLDKKLKPIWGKSVVYHKKSCCTFNIPSCLADVSSSGDIYFTGSYFEGGTFDEKNSFTAPIVDSVTQYNKSFESYLACYSNDGELKWVKTCGGKSIFSAIEATEDGVIIGGHMRNNVKFFGTKIDTSGGQRMVLASFSNKGKMKWVKTSNANTINSIAIDHDQNIYISVVGKIRSLEHPLVLGTDTVLDAYNDLIIASFSENGTYRWYKKSDVPMSSNEFPQISVDRCGNIYISGEMWYVLKSQVSWFDAAFVKGEGYGAAPFVAKLNNTLPPEIVEILSSGKNDDVDDVCIISPGPWELFNYPNPYKSSTTISYKISYDDPSVSLYVYNLSGDLIATLFENRNLSKGKGEVKFNKELAPGVYIAVLKGTGNIATTRMVVTK